MSTHEEQHPTEQPGGYKADLHRYLQVAREAVVWKLDGVSEYDARRPLTATGTNLLGLVKHLAGVEAGYFGEVFGRPFPDEPAWMGPQAEPNADMWATAVESRDEVVALYRRAWAHADETIAGADLGTVGHVPWWGDGGAATLHRLLVHVTTETHRHAGHADIIRELVDGAAGMRADDDNLWQPEDGWAGHVARLEQAARDAGSR